MRRTMMIVLCIVIGIAMCSVSSATTTEESTWGKIKSLYRTPGEVNQEPEGRGTWDPSGWQLAIIREAKYALSRRMNGTSRNIYKYGSGYYFVGDWNFVNSDANALRTVKSTCNLPTGSYGIWWERNDGRWLKIGRGGYCKFFANLVQWRATGGRKGCLPTNTSASGSIDWVEPGDIIQKPQYYGHTAIVIKILARYSDGRVKKVDVIDSNYIGGDGKYIIARHPISRPALSSYRTYH